MNTRREFLRNTIVTGAMAPLVSADAFSIKPSPSAEKLKVYIFSKHLQFLNYKELAQAAAEMGFDGIDLSVRPKGHVLPERVEEDLPKAADEMKKVGLGPALMTTAVNDADNATDKTLLTTASKLGFKYYRTNWYSYPDNQSIPDALDAFSKKMIGLGALNRNLGLTGYYQNHSGLSAGSNIFEIYEMIKDADKDFIGAQYDIRHAMVEGSQSWENGLRLIEPRIKAVTVKDFKWNNGKENVIDVPLGDGVVDFKHYFKLLKQYNVHGPVTLHIEYPLGGAEKGNTEIKIARKEVFKAMKKDLKRVHELWEQA